MLSQKNFHGQYYQIPKIMPIKSSLKDNHSEALLFGSHNMRKFSTHIQFMIYTQCATPKLPKKVLHIGDIVAHWGHCPEKIEMIFLIKNRPFLPILKSKGQVVKTALEVNFIILKTMFNPTPLIFVIFELKGSPPSGPLFFKKRSNQPGYQIF